MGHSPYLWLKLLVSGGHAPQDRSTWPEAPPGSGPLVWIALSAGERAAGLRQLAGKLRRSRRDLRFVVTYDAADAPELSGFPEHTATLPHPGERRETIRAFLDRYAPDLLLLAGPDLPPVRIHETHARGIPMILANARVPGTDWTRRRWMPGLDRALLSRIDVILAEDAEAARRLTRLGGRRLPIDVTGKIEETAEPPRCNEAERESLASLIRARQVWLAAMCTAAEEDAILAAHTRAMGLAHRMLLILVPEEIARGPAIAERVAASGLDVALRSAEQEPEEEVQVFVADTENEIGLWYRLAPVTFMGGTLSPGTAARNPFEPAALGSAILHGPHLGTYAEEYARLHAARAALQVTDAARLGDMVGELIAPDKAASLAHNAWQVSSGGADATDSLTRVVMEALRRRQAPGSKTDGGSA